MPKFSAYTAETSPASTDILLLDNSSGSNTRKITMANLAIAAQENTSAVHHRNVFRGKSLGSTITTAQQSAISAGTFADLFIGDYWTIDSVSWRIADMDYWYGCGDEGNYFNTHHLVIVPDSVLTTAAMNSSNTTEGGYVGSEMYTTVLPGLLSTVQSAFGSLLLTHREYLVNAVTDGHPSAGAWYDSTIDLRNEQMMYGCPIRQAMNDGSTVAATTTICKSQLALYQLRPYYIRYHYGWLRDVVSASSFARARSGGGASNISASHSRNVRPAFAVGVAA
ncbi:MAG: hypothetical protein LIO54_00900 [Oscillospiraceae bacterium]|nr:hypothetical protein [Oscillospiraceae bacterium]